MEIAITVIRSLALSQVLLFALILWFSPNPVRIRITGVTLLSGVSAYLLIPMLASLGNHQLREIADVLASIVPSLLLLFSWYLFEENTRAPTWLALYVFLSIALTVAFVLVCCDTPGDSSLFLLIQCNKIVAFALTAYVLWQGRDSDLVETRRRIRNLLIVLIFLIGLCIVIIELITGFQVPQTVEAVGVFIIFVAALSFNFLFIRSNPTAEIFASPRRVINEPQDPLVKLILQRMLDERLYADHDLRVASLADKLQMPEYQLRKRINQQLGFRNFNQFVNQYRVEEAAARLLKQPDLPVLTIALDVGFRSISSFNTSFLAHHGVSPTQYRANT